MYNSKLITISIDGILFILNSFWLCLSSKKFLLFCVCVCGVFCLFYEKQGFWLEEFLHMMRINLKVILNKHFSYFLMKVKFQMCSLWSFFFPDFSHIFSETSILQQDWGRRVFGSALGFPLLPRNIFIFKFLIGMKNKDKSCCF